tara:strand:+ start:382 stop:687 length:306 start_codon:yes stop_codon:yes gene_type:complete
MTKEAKRIYDKDRYESRKDGLYTVYYLKKEHYVGMTSDLTSRLYRHKSQEFNRYVEDVEVVGKYKTKAEARNVEAKLHLMGYLGAHPGRKGHKKEKTNATL